MDSLVNDQIFCALKLIYNFLPLLYLSAILLKKELFFLIVQQNNMKKIQKKLIY